MNITRRKSVEGLADPAGHNRTPGTMPPPAEEELLGYMFDAQQARLIRKVAGSELPVLIQGETGVGKEVLARCIHQASPRSGSKLTKVNCASLPSELVESELFGYRKGAFTGADRDKPGRFEIANEGTILLDEIAEMSLPVQSKLLQVLQEQEFDPLGATCPVKVNVRVIAATQCDLEQAAANGDFREDLYYRLSVFTIRILPLRERRNQILPLARHFMLKHGGAPDQGIPESLQSAFLAHDWPGNARELESAVRCYLLTEDDKPVLEKIQRFAVRRAGRPPREAPGAEPQGSSKLPPRKEPFPDERGLTSQPLKRLALEWEEAERRIILEALNSTQWNRRRTAVRLGLDYKALLYRMEKLGIGRTQRAAGAAS